VPIAVLVGYSCNASQLNDLAANESAMHKAFHEGDRVYCGLHIDDIVIVQAER
jgi:spermidine/putrescine transport system ATP-binding protein